MATIIGTNNAEALQATLADPMVIALSGNDTALGSTGDDNINGNQGDDLIFGSTGNDSLRGGQGNDQILGEDGEDTLWGDKGNDNIWGGNGNDQIFGNVGTDFINGNQGNDTLWGGEDNDTVRGGQGNDSILGDNGNDSLYGDKGADTLAGGAGSDNFVIGNGTGGSNLTDADWFSDYTDGTDRITLDGLTFANLTVAQGTGANANNTTIRNTATGEWLAVVAGVNATNITASDFGEAEPAASPPPTPQGTNTLPAFPPPELAVIPAVPPAAPPAPPPPPVATIAAGTAPTEAGPVNGTFTVTLDTAPTADVAIGYSFNGSTATGGGVDYSDPGNGSLTIAAGSTTGTITTNIVNDTLLDPDETIIATLSAGTGYTVGTTNTATLTITDDELPTITVAPVVGAAEQIAPGTNTVVPGEFVFTRTGTPAQIAAALTGVGFAVGGTATAGTDYTSIGTTVDFAAGSAQATVTVTPINDTEFEGGETVTVTLNTPPVTGFDVGGTGTASLSIADDDQPNIVITASQPNAEEWNTGTGAVVPGQYTLTRTGSAAQIATAQAVSVSFGGTATKGTDYTVTVDPSDTGGTTYTAGAVTFAAGQTTAILAVTPVRDINGAEGSETAIATIAPPAGYVVSGDSATATVTIADEPLTITAATGTQPAENGPVNGTFILTRTGATTSALNATYTFDAASTATGGGTDYTDIGGGTATFGVGQNTTTIELLTIDDATPEVGETIILNSVTATGYTVTGTPQTLTIVDDDVPTVTVTATDPTASENAGETGTFTFTGAAGTVVNYTVSGTATSGTDFTALAGTITLTGTPATDVVTVTATDDATVDEVSETVIVTIDASTASPPAYNIGGTGTATVSITDNDGTTAGNDNLVGSTGIDIMSGGDGNDTLTGGAGADQLTGGNGADQFRFNATTEGTDVIADFVVGTDKILASQATFGGLAAGPLAAANFVSGAAATAAVPQFIYNAGALSFDIDGTGAMAAVDLATLTGAPALTNTDIELF